MFGLIVFGVFLVTNALNFAVIALDNRIIEGRRLLQQVQELFVPMLPGQVAAGALTAVLAVAYMKLGVAALIGAVLVIGIFQYLMVALLRSEDRADQLEARSIHLASLQLGVLSTLVETLALRDKSTARHAAAVARYARKLALKLGLDELEQDLAHTAGLLHDIGKFALPDRILHAEVLTDEDWAVVRRHPQDGATLVGRLDGYGPVADAILYHHEHVDGSGYPAGLIGSRDPADLADRRDLLDLRHAHRARLLPLADDTAGRDERAAPRRRPPAGRGASSRVHRDARGAGPGDGSRRRFGQLRGRARIRPAHAEVRAAAVQLSDEGAAPARLHSRRSRKERAPLSCTPRCDALNSDR